jgi:hypothetical protein
MTIEKQKNRVFPGNKNIHYWYFLIEVSDPQMGHIGCYLCEQAYTGYMSDRKEASLWGAVAAQCSMNSAKTGLVYRIAAFGSRKFCVDHAREFGMKWTS